MARPKSNQSTPSASDRLEAAFWAILAEMPFSTITVSALSARAGVNHNTFYYYFDSIEDMAQKLFERNMMPELPKVLLPLLAAGMADFGEVMADPQVDAHFKRACLFARSDSALLTGILRDSVMRLWLDTVGLKEEDLSQEQQDRLTFVFGGLVAALGDMGEQASLTRISAIVESPLGKGIFETLSQVAASAN